MRWQRATWKDKKKVKEQWHKHFMWWPTRMKPDNPRTVVWLETVERKGEHYSNWGDGLWIWDYKELQ